MNYGDFIPSRGSQPLRQTLWGHYQALSDYFVNQLGFAPTVQSVQEGAACWHCQSAIRSYISVPFDQNHEGAIFHELTHDLFHHSVFHHLHNRVNAFPGGQDRNAAFNESWGEGFCDAVRWLMETTRLKSSPWLQSYPGQKAHDWRIQRAERILCHTGRTLPDFAAGWKALAAAYDGTANFLNQTIP